MILAVFLITHPGGDLDGEERRIEADSVEEAMARATALEALYGYRLTYLGTRAGMIFTPALPYEALPWWAQRWLDETTPVHLARRERKPRVAKAKTSTKPFCICRGGPIPCTCGMCGMRSGCCVEDRKASRGAP